RTVVIGAATVLGFHIVADASSAASVHAVGDASAAAASHAVGAASSAGGLVASFVSRSGWIAVPLVLGHAVASARGHRASAEERARLAEQTREEHAQRRVAEERLRIARELHDVVSHSISVINLQAGVALHVIDQQPEQARSALIAIKGTSKETLRELRGILGLLRKDEDAEPREPAPGLDQLDALIEATTRVGVPTRLSIEGQSRRLSPAVELTAYRIVQESLTNVLQHAGRASAAVTLRYEDDRIAIDVADDGRGAVPGDGAGLGVVGMRERASAVGGGLEAGPDAAGGFRVSAWLPAPRDAP
ncbi:MAG TPA: sensor histidine kinase, partial [Chloroflexota bacterium]|nr:sensor histidine kinase [Chloroflexota bacterium]